MGVGDQNAEEKKFQQHPHTGARVSVLCTFSDISSYPCTSAILSFLALSTELVFSLLSGVQRLNTCITYHELLNNRFIALKLSIIIISELEQTAVQLVRKSDPARPCTSSDTTNRPEGI